MIGGSFGSSLISRQSRFDEERGPQQASSLLARPKNGAGRSMHEHVSVYIGQQARLRPAERRFYGFR